MLVDPRVKKYSSPILIKYHPTYAPHRSRSFKVLLPGFIAAERFGHCADKYAIFIDLCFAAEVIKVIFVQTHAVKFKSHAALQFGVFRHRSLAIFEHNRKGIHQFVGISNIALIKREVIFYQCFAETGHPDQ